MKKYLSKFTKYFLYILALYTIIILCYFNNNYKIFNKTNNLDKSVFKISMYNYSLEQISTATAFSVHYNIIRNKSLILTNHHFCESFIKEGLIIEVSSKIFKEITLASIIDIDEKNDLCLMEIAEKTIPLELKDSCSHGDKVIIYGAPDGIFPIIIDSYVSYSDVPKKIFKMEEPEEELIMISAIVLPGHSGSPVIKDGYACGIVFAASKYYGGLATKAKYINKFISSHISYF